MFETFTDTNIFSDGNYNLYNETIDPSGNLETIIVTEKARLENKQKVVKLVYNTEKRKKEQLKSTTLRKRAYNRMLLVFLGILIVSVGLLVLQNYFPIIPEWINDWLLIFIIGGGACWLIYLYFDILKRDKMDFEKVDFGLKTKDDDDETDGEYNLIQPSSSSTEPGCIGMDCCSDGQYFVNNQCQDCPAGMKMNSLGECVTSCPDGTEYINGECKTVDAFSTQRVRSAIEPFSPTVSFVLKDNANQLVIQKPMKPLVSMP